MKDLWLWTLVLVLVIGVWARQLYIRGKNVRKVTELLNARVQFTHHEFGRAHFGDSTLRAQLARDVREILSQHVPIPLDGLSPQDRFQEQLLMDTFDSMSSVEFIRVLEQKYDVSLRCERFLARDLTFGELIDILARKMAESHREHS